MIELNLGSFQKGWSRLCRFDGWSPISEKSERTEGGYDVCTSPPSTISLNEWGFDTEGSFDLQVRGLESGHLRIRFGTRQ